MHRINWSLFRYIPNSSRLIRQNQTLLSDSSLSRSSIRIYNSVVFSSNINLNNPVQDVPFTSDSNCTSNSSSRFNPLGIQMLSNSLYRQVFPKYYNKSTAISDNTSKIVARDNKPRIVALSTHSTTKAETALELSKKHLSDHDLLGKNLAPLPEIDLPLPPLVTAYTDPSMATIEEHFRIISLEQAEPYLSQTRKFAASNLPDMPKTWIKSAGWTQYNSDGSTTLINHPPFGEALVFDVEVMYKISLFPTIAIAASATSWYSWCSPAICGGVQPCQDLISFGKTDIPRIIVGHNVSYDRARILEEYQSESTKNALIDTMSLHCAVSGMSSQQRMLWTQYRKSKIAQDKMEFEDEYATPPPSPLVNGMTDLELADANPWLTKTSVNSLFEVAKLHLKRKVDKAVRDYFSSSDMSQFDDPALFQTLMSYCAEDVKVTHELFGFLFPRFEVKCPHPASFAGVLHMGKSYLTVTSDWKQFVDRCENICSNTQQSIEHDLSALAESALALAEGEAYKNDPWFKFLDWTPKKVRLTMPKYSSKDGSIVHPARPFKSKGDAHLIDKPKWYCDQWDSSNKRLLLSTSRRIVPYLLRMNWDGFPISYCRAYGWMYRRPVKDIPPDSECLKLQLSFSVDPKDKAYDPIATFDEENAYFRIPHTNGENQNCGNPLSKPYIAHFEKGILTSAVPEAQNILEKHAQCTYWISSRARINGQFIVWDSAKQPLGYASHANDDNIGVILPCTIPMGTITRRAVEPLWMTASNAKENRIGSEVKSMIMPAKGYSLVGADVDSEELWIASVFGDAQFGQHGSTAIGFMTLQGAKAAGTDLHSTTGKILGISRNQSKVFNYGRIYGAGIRYAVQLLMQGNSNLTREMAEKKAEQLYKSTKGRRHRSLGRFDNLWHGGTESMMFNTLDWIATYSDPRTPILGCQIPDALMPQNVRNQFMPSRINWAVQSSGVDYLHLLLISMNYLMRRLNIDGRFLISIHDEVRYIIKDEHVDLACLALHISNLWTRAMFSSRLGLHDLPLNVAFFSLVDVDHCLRKEVDMQCVTPSNGSPIPPGRSLTVNETIERLKSFLSKKNPYGPELESVTQMVEKFKKANTWTPPLPVPLPELDILRAQLCRTQMEIRKIENPILTSRKPKVSTHRTVVPNSGISAKM
ncbi:DNA-directed DNA polymerase gamma mip1 [Batrachochytrium dendrobatidis]|nr:DNA-directed DNA polymerase gamma mip1 [Batrachochytrium dendrobatidis]